MPSLILFELIRCVCLCVSEYLNTRLFVRDDWILLSDKLKVKNIYRPQAKLREGNVFTPV